MDVLLVVDMQEGLLQGKPKHDLSGVVERINRLAARVRERGGRVLFVQHDGPPGDDFAPFTPGWAILGSLERHPSDPVVRKTLNDAFFRTVASTHMSVAQPATRTRPVPISSRSD